MVQAKVKHPFRVIKRQFGHVKTRYRGLAKNRAQLFTLFALGNLFLGSGLIDHLQKMTMATMAIADMKVWAQRS